MLTKIIDFSIKNRLIIGLLTLALIAWGIYNFIKLPIDAVPDITNNQVQVITVSPSLAPQEVEQFITFPVEIAMANIQGVTEIRSISRFGLSVVTIVFQDKMSTHLARQLVGEQIKMAEDEIPEGYGKPEMMPITTGLGEIYQYVLEPKRGYENAFTPMDIRTIHDWIVKRQLSGIPGIVEISSFGGHLKQYVVSINPRNLVGMDLTITEIFNAIEENNQNSGGSYIEKGPNSYYIRAEGLVKSVEDIENIVIKNIHGTPILIKDVAIVKLGSPPRFGAMTKDGKGEAVGGITLMLKGANTNEVIGHVKERIELVKKTLPEGLELNPYLDRSGLIKKTIRTVKNNLVEGGLIVIFILILLLGSYRSGLIVASVIPLSMLFAFSMMNLFGVTANLMSLGAIDFGLIVDGAVIVVEGIVYLLHKNFKDKTITQRQMDKTVSEAGSQVIRSATFGVIIILIVYLPILAFQGIEGKTFKPMAQTVSFALLGALILSLTYVPMISSLFLSKQIREKKTLADKIIDFLNRSHEPVLNWALRQQKLLIGSMAAIFMLSLVFFTGIGGEFLPTLEEGDLAAQMTITPGSSLSESIQTSTKAEKILMDNFPEVISVVSKIGTAEVPTDPMAVEDADIMIIMKEKEEWVSAKTREELVEKMKKKLEVLPGASFEFTQPIQLRFNELMTGVKSDVAVKIYGEDLDELYDQANKAAAIIQKVEGAGDVRVEQIVGLPQMMIRYKRDQLARYGLNVNEINKVVRTAFAGESAGLVFEGERRFDLVIRLDKEFRKDIENLERLRINRPDGELILLSQVADIIIEKGPMQISRDNTKRRITIGINIRNRDVESFVEEIDGKLSEGLRLLPGYYTTYGGQFENLQTAKKTSSIAVPVSLALILILLYFAFHSLKQAIMIFTAIPLAAVGGVLSLYIRGMPFSISAGVGFIALFGIVVLNGIVLISYYNQLESEGITDIYERVRIGTKVRLRPVILTASTDALGFFPMALSNAPGAEVQKPLATVVIGGLVTATFLTLVVLPVIYVLFNNTKNKPGRKRNRIKNIAGIFLIPGLLMFSQMAFSQEPTDTITLDKAISRAEEQNPTLKNAILEVEKYHSLKKASVEIPSPEILYERGQINSGVDDYKITVSQSFKLPWAYTAGNAYQKKWIQLKEQEYEWIKRKVIKEIRSVYSEWLMLYAYEQILQQRDSIYQKLLISGKLQNETGNISPLEWVMVQAESQQIQNGLNSLRMDIKIMAKKLQELIFTRNDLIPEEREMFQMEGPSFPQDINQYTPYALTLSEAEIAASAIKLNNANIWPEFSLGYFNQSINGTDAFDGWQVGVKVPLWFWSKTQKAGAAKKEYQMALNEVEKEKLAGIKWLETLQLEYQKVLTELTYYAETGSKQADMMVHAAQKSYETGQIGYIEYAKALLDAFNLKQNYYKTLNHYNQVVININFINGK